MPFSDAIIEFQPLMITPMITIIAAERLTSWHDTPTFSIRHIADDTFAA